jgi:hypothetical protein
LDENSDWFDLVKNPWLNKEQRKVAKEMVEIEAKRAEEMDSKMTVDINLETGDVRLRQEQDAAFEFGQ